MTKIVEVDFPGIKSRIQEIAKLQKCFLELHKFVWKFLMLRWKEPSFQLRLKF